MIHMLSINLHITKAVFRCHGQTPMTRPTLKLSGLMEAPIYFDIKSVGYLLLSNQN